MSVSAPLILFYSAFFGEHPDFSRSSASTSCEFSVDRSRLHEADAVILHLPLLAEFSDARKYPGQWWIGWSMENCTHTPIRTDAALMRHFDMLKSFEADADIRCTYYPKWDEWQAAMARPTAAPVFYRRHDGRLRRGVLPAGPAG